MIISGACAEVAIAFQGIEVLLSPFCESLDDLIVYHFVTTGPVPSPQVLSPCTSELLGCSVSWVPSVIDNFEIESAKS